MRTTIWSIIALSVFLSGELSAQPAPSWEAFFQSVSNHESAYILQKVGGTERFMEVRWTDPNTIYLLEEEPYYPPGSMIPLSQKFCAFAPEELELYLSVTETLVQSSRVQGYVDYSALTPAYNQLVKEKCWWRSVDFGFCAWDEVPKIEDYLAGKISIPNIESEKLVTLQVDVEGQLLKGKDGRCILDLSGMLPDNLIFDSLELNHQLNSITSKKGTYHPAASAPVWQAALVVHGN
ncbi:MAG: hypothetical protein KDC44_11235, partial [Phaeodactylibacter sp.]|nr:hypothetical protein [Phaeodactylibacter sp.]